MTQSIFVKDKMCSSWSFREAFDESTSAVEFTGNSLQQYILLYRVAKCSKLSIYLKHFVFYWNYYDFFILTESILVALYGVSEQKCKDVSFRHWSKSQFKTSSMKSDS